MSRKSKLTDEERMAAVQEYLAGKGSTKAIAKKYGINRKRLIIYHQ
ncbi:MAG: transposase [Oscillospiraceae bacterium]|nr:transposase [Oscillospiraceae bacterium]